MRIIDAFNHFNPKRYHEELLQSPAGQKDIGKRVRGIPALWDLDRRLQVVDEFTDYTQVLSLGMPMVDRLWGPDKSPEMAKLANDGLAEVVAKHSDRFVGYSCVVPMNAPEAAAKDCIWPKTESFAAEDWCRQASLAMTVPSGNGRVPSRNALTAMSLPRIARRSSRPPASCATPISRQSR